MCALIIAPGASSAQLEAATTIEENLNNVVKIWCGYYNEEGDTEIYSQGSGVVLDDNLVLTNAHVAFYLDELDPDGTYYFYDFCLGGIGPNSYTAPVEDFVLEYSSYNWDADFDYVFMEALDPVDGTEWSFESQVTYGNPDSLVHGDDITLFGYPAVAGSTITSTQGSVSGFEGTTLIRSDAVSDHGGSGGGAFDANGDFLGLVTWGLTGAINSFTGIQNINAIIEDAFEEGAIIRDYNTLYTGENMVCFATGECYNFGESSDVDLGEEEIDESEGAEDLPDDDDVSDEPVESIGSEIDAGRYIPEKHDQVLIDRLEGSILLQVDEHGEAWYINPDDGLRYYMKDGAVAYEMMRSFGLGITNVDLEEIPAVENTDEMLEASSVCAMNSLADRLKGDILLQVEKYGEAWWVHPETCYRIYMKDGDAAYTIMRFLSLGISSEDLSKMPTGDIE